VVEVGKATGPPAANLVRVEEEAVIRRPGSGGSYAAMMILSLFIAFGGTDQA